MSAKVHSVSDVGEFEILLLVSIRLLESTKELAYGVTIQERAAELCAGIRSVSFGSIYQTLNRMEKKGYVRSWFGDPTPERGGKAKKFYRLTRKGSLAMQRTMELKQRLSNVVRTIWGD